MIKIYINRQHIAENRDLLKKGNAPLPPIMIEQQSGEITHVFGVSWKSGSVIYAPECLHAEPNLQAPDLWIEVEELVELMGLDDWQQ